MKYQKMLLGETDIFELDIQVRQFTALKRTRIDYIETLLCLRENMGDAAFRKFLLHLPNIGKSSVTIICDSLDKYITDTGRRPK